MKVLFVSHERNRKGSSISMLSTIRFLIEIYGWEIDVLLPYYGLAETTLKDRKIQHQVLYYFSDYRRIGKKEKVREGIKELANFIAVKRLRKKLRKEKYDYVISNSTAVDIGARAAIGLKVKHIYYVREFMEEGCALEYRNKNRMKSLLEASDKVIFISQAIANKYVSMYEIKNYRIIYNGVIREDYYIENHEILNQPTLQLLQIGELCGTKGTKESIEFIGILKKYISCHLTLVGHSSKSYLDELQEYISQNQLECNITIISYTKDILSLLKKGDILLVNSRFEGFGRTTVEGMLGGLLVLGRDTGGTKEIIANDKIGILFHNKQEFVSKIIEVERDRNLYKKIALNGQKFALEHFSPAENAKNITEYLKEI